MSTSNKSNIMKNYWVWAFLSILFQACTIIILKYAAISCEGRWCWSFLYLYLIAVSLMFSRVIFWNKALSLGKLSDVYAFTATTPVILLLLSIVVLNERISLTSAIGASVVVWAIYMHKRPQ